MKKLHLILIVLLSLSLMNCSKVQMKPGNYLLTFTYDNPNIESIQKYTEVMKSPDDILLLRLVSSFVELNIIGNKVSGKIPIESLNSPYLVGEIKNNTITGRFAYMEAHHSPGGGNWFVEREGSFEIK
jgi:hypothetical protein